MRKVFLRSAPKIFWSSFTDPPCQQCQFLAYPPTPPVSTSVFGLPPYPPESASVSFWQTPYPRQGADVIFERPLRERVYAVYT